MKVFKTDRVILFKANKTPKAIKLSVNPIITPKQEQKPPILVQNNFLNKKKYFFNVEKMSEIEQEEINEGRWNLKEHINFLKGIEQYGVNWKKINVLIPTRTTVQIRTHANKFLKRLKHFKDETLGIDLTSSAIRNIKDVINHIKSINEGYNIFDIFMLISGKNFDKTKQKYSENKDKKNCKSFNDNDVDIFNINNIYNDYEKPENEEELSKEKDETNKINNSLNNNYINYPNFIGNLNYIDLLSYSYLSNLIYIYKTNIINNNNNQYLYIPNNKVDNDFAKTQNSTQKKKGD